MRSEMRKRMIEYGSGIELYPFIILFQNYKAANDIRGYKNYKNYDMRFSFA